jgi:hypothetical protein
MKPAGATEDNSSHVRGKLLDERFRSHGNSRNSVLSPLKADRLGHQWDTVHHMERIMRPVDRRTIVAGGFLSHANPSLMAKIPYDPVRDFQPVTIAAGSPNLLVVTPSLPVKTVKELIDYIRRSPGVSFASPGVGTTPHLSGEMFRLALALDMVHVPFGGANAFVKAPRDLK